MSLQRTYKLKCDGCGRVHTWPEPAAKHGASHLTPRRARAAAKADGWQRIKVVVGQESVNTWGQDSQGRWYRTGKMEMVDVIAGRDFCPACAAKVGGE